ncbi:unnamed protein product [Rotaria sp. Silwood2]|nr:unnamed protein product [Rotaria sp. Silwood2]CAF3962607.1 unnamed protein product [Rotaria sp. Silwood2]
MLLIHFGVIGSSLLSSVTSTTIRSAAEQATTEHRQLLENRTVTESLLGDHEESKDSQRNILTFLDDTEIVRLNVGGELMSTSRSTLTRVINSTLARMFDGSPKYQLQFDRDGNVFLDFNPVLFHHLLEQLRMMENDDSQQFHAPSSQSLIAPFNKMLQKLGLDPAPRLDTDIIILNVGGEIIMTYRDTLIQLPDSKLATIVSSNESVSVDSSGHIFLDFNPRLFRHLLDQLRSRQKTTIHSFKAPSNEDTKAFNSMLISLGLKSLRRAYDICANARWAQYGTPVIWGYENGNWMRQEYNYPRGLYVDDNGTLYVADASNHRIMESLRDAIKGRTVAGGHGNGSRSDQMNKPVDFIIDEDGSLIICDSNNYRVVRWFRGADNGEIIVSNIGCWGLAMDDQKCLYISDWVNDRVIKLCEDEIDFTLVAGGKGSDARLDQLNGSRHLVINRDRSIYVADVYNDRVMKWDEGANEGIVVAGGNSRGSNLDQLSQPLGVIVDELHTVYVADTFNHRIVRWPQGATVGSVMIDGNGDGANTDQLSYPTSISFDQYGNLYVSDFGNHRVLKFKIDTSLCLAE